MKLVEVFEHNYPTWKRYVKSAFRSFLAGALPYLVASFNTEEIIKNPSKEVLMTLAWGALVAGIYSLIKAGDEVVSGRLEIKK
jgi:hypothetical protein